MRRLLFCLLAIAMLPAAGVGFAADFMINVDGRRTTSLNGRWQYIIDPYELGYYNYRWAEDQWGFFRNARPQRESDLVEYEFNDNHTLQVPGDWNTQDDRFFYYEGTMWYKKDFADPRTDRNNRLFIYFGAANYESIVYVNGQKLGVHEGGFTPFQYEITDIVQPEGNFVVVKVDNKRRRDGVPTLNTDWWNYGGITRRVLLIEVPQVYVDDYKVQLARGDLDTIAGYVQLRGAEGPREVTLSIAEAGIEQKLTTDAEGRAEFSIDVPGLELWSPENPRRYEVTISSGDDTVTDLIGFRTIETRGNRILLNGEPIFLRGVCLHEESPILASRAVGEDDARILLGWAKELNCNFVRLAHYPHNEAMVRTAEEMGLLVWSEIPVYWTILFDNEEVYAKAEGQLADMIRRDKNRAAVILWSVGNETPVHPQRTRFMSRLARRAKELDGTRLVTAALETSYTDQRTIDIHDPLGAELDVLGCNEYIGWYDGPPQKPSTINWTTPYDKPLIISEFGGGAPFGNRGRETARWTEEYQRTIYEHQTEMFKRIDFLAGTTPWILKDFRSPRRPLYGIQDGFNRKGLVSDRGEKKQAFYVMQKFYAEKAAETLE